MIFYICRYADKLSLKRETGRRVGNLNAKSLGTLDDLDALAGTDVVGNLGSVSLGLEKEELELRKVGHNENLVAAGNQILRLLVRAVADLGHTEGAPEPTADTRVNTLRLAPLIPQALVTVVVVALKLLPVLLMDRRVRESLSHFLRELCEVGSLEVPVFFAKCYRGFGDFRVRALFCPKLKARSQGWERKSAD